MEIARTVDEAYHACHPEIPLEADDFRYVDLTEARGGFDLAEVFSRRIRRTPSPTFHKQLVTGHRGCGKSTELKQLKASLEKLGFFVVYIDVEDVLDLGEIEYLDVLVSIAKGVYEKANDCGLDVHRKLVEELDKWFAEKVLTEEQRQDVERALRAEFGVGAKVPLLRMLAVITGQIKSGSSRRVEIRRRLERELSVFIQRLNALLEDVQVRLAKRGKKGLVVIADGLEKMHYRELPDGQSTHSKLFVEHAEQLKAPHCHIVYTVPISLVFNVNLGDAFPNTDVLPMVKVAEPNEARTPYEPGRKALFEIISRRINIEAIFENERPVWKLVEVCGGSVRDLLRLVRFACDEADEVITEEHVERAVRRMAREYDYLVHEDEIPYLKEIAQKRRVPGDEASARLLQKRLVLEYLNDERWADVHPILRKTPRGREILGG